MRSNSLRWSTLILGVWTLVAEHARADDNKPPKTLGELSLEELMTVRVSLFSVSTEKDRNYLASNSISASRIDTPIMNLPFAIQAFTENFIADQRPETIWDIAKYSPSVTYRSNDFTEGNANLSIRGFAVGNKPGDGQILRDGYRGPSIFEFTNIARLEIVKGPASFLYGQIAPGGIVNIITKSPQPKFASHFQATYGSYNSYRVQGDVTGPATKRLFYRLAASYHHDINYWDPYDAYSTDLAPSVVWQPNDRVRLTLKYENYRKRETPPVFQKPGWSSSAGIPTPQDPNLSGVAVPGLPDNWNSMSTSDYRNSDTNAVTVSMNIKLTDHWDLRAGYAYEKYSIDSAFSGNFGVTNGSFIQGRRFRRSTYTNIDNTFESEAVGRYRFGKVSLRVLLGAQYIYRTFGRSAGQAPADPALGDNPASPLPPWDLRDDSTWNRINNIPLSALSDNGQKGFTSSQDSAGYGGATLGFFDDRVLVLAGVRYTYTTSRITDQLPVMATSKSSTGKFTPQFGLLYKPIAGLSLFATYSESFVPNPQMLLVKNVPTTPAVPTEGQGYDIGLKVDLFHSRFSGTLTFYQIRNKNILNDIAVFDAATGSQVFTNVQSGEQRSTGVEIDTTLTLTKNWQLYLSFSWMDAKIFEFSGNDHQVLAQDPNTLDAVGRTNYKNALAFHNAPLQMSAPYLANLWTRYDLTHTVLKGFYVAGGFNLVVDQTLLPDTPSAYNQTYALLNGMLGYKWKFGKCCTMSIDVVGKNLLDANYRPSQSTRSRPREFAGTLTIWL